MSRDLDARADLTCSGGHNFTNTAAVEVQPVSFESPFSGLFNGIECMELRRVLISNGDLFSF